MFGMGPSGSGGLGDLRTITLQEPVNFGDILRFEVGIFARCFIEIGNVLAGAVTATAIRFSARFRNRTSGAWFRAGCSRSPMHLT
jgi:hypothetical protein